MNIPRRISTTLVHSLTSGVVPRIGLEYVAVGRRYETEALLCDLQNTAEGGSAFRLITGRYGSGKTFMLQTLRNYAMDRDFAVADADLSPERRLTGTKGQGLATYRELVSRLATRTRPDGGALEVILQKWLSLLQRQEGPGDMAERIQEAAERMENMVHGLDFAAMLSAYARGVQTGNDGARQAALKWLRGEYPTRTEAKNALSVNAIIDDDTWYDYIKLWAEFTVKTGYKGLVLFIDEGVNLYKIGNAPARASNYEKLLTIFNDTMQGKAAHLAVFMGGTPQFVEDERRGLYSYEALHSRLTEGRFSATGLKNLSAPALKLEPLSHEEILLLLQKLRALHECHYEYKSAVTDEQLVAFMQEAVSRMGAEKLLTAREIIRDFMDLQDILRQNPEAAFEDLVQGHKTEAAAQDPDDVQEFLAEFEL